MKIYFCSVHKHSLKAQCARGVCWLRVTYFLKGGNSKRHALSQEGGGGGFKNWQKRRHIFCEWPLTGNTLRYQNTFLW